MNELEMPGMCGEENRKEVYNMIGIEFNHNNEHKKSETAKNVL